MEEDNTIEQSSWNLSQSIISELTNLLARASTYYVIGNYEGCFNNLKAVRLRIVGNLTKDEREAFKKKEVEAQEILSKKIGIDNFDLQSEKDYYKNHGHKVPELVEEYNELIMDTLKTYGYLIPKKQDETKMIA